MPLDAVVVLITLGAYHVALLWIGAACRQRAQSEADYILGGKALGPWVTALSACASSSSSWTLLGVSGFAYRNGLCALWLLPGCIGGFALNWFLLGERLRRYTADTSDLSVIDVLARPARGHASERAIRVVAVGLLVASLLLYVAAQFHAAGLAFGSTFAVDPRLIVLAGAAVVVAYTWSGGFWAVSVTDTLQGLLMVVAAVALPVAGLVAVGGFGALAEGIHRLGPAYRSLTHDEATTAALGLVFGLLSIGLGYPGQPHVVNRFMAVRDAAALRRARVISMTWAVLIYSGMVLAGLCARIVVPALANAESSFMELTRAAFPSVVTGLMLATVLSAIMSTVDTQLLSAGTAITHDLGLRASGPAAALRRSRLVVALVSAGAAVAAVLGSDTLFNRVLFAWTTLGAAFGPLLLCTVFLGPVSPLATVATMVMGAGLSVATYYTPGASRWLMNGLPIVMAAVVAVAGVRRREVP
ncbi:MAG: sodium/solute symporter [Planctomycetota bacterium]